MIPDVIGLPAEEARMMFEKSGIQILDENVAPPPDFHRIKKTEAPMDFYVAGQDEPSPGSVRLKIAAVPRIAPPAVQSE